MSPEILSLILRERTHCDTLRYMSEKRGQLSMRPSGRVLRMLDERSSYLGERKTALAERYLREGLDMDENPGIYFVDAPMGRRPAVMGCGLDVWEIVRAMRENGSIDETAEYLEIDPQLVNVAMRYYGSHREEIDQWIERFEARSRREQELWRMAQLLSTATN